MSKYNGLQRLPFEVQHRATHSSVASFSTREAANAYIEHAKATGIINDSSKFEVVERQYASEDWKPS